MKYSLKTLPFRISMTGVCSDGSGVGEDYTFSNLRYIDQWYHPVITLDAWRYPDDEGVGLAATIYVAQNLIGTPYAENSNPPETFDCAKFTLWCYDKAQSGTMKDSSKNQGYDERYDKVGYGDLKRGDLVCFNTISTDDDESDHVGIYIGDGYFIHASSAGGKVMVSQMVSGSSDYYKRNFSWGRRIFK